MARLIVALAILFSTTLATAQVHIDLYGGGSLPDADDTTLRPTYLVVGSYKFDFGLTLGGLLWESTKEEDLGRFEYVLKGIEVGYYFEKWVKGFYMAFRTGLVDMETELSGVEFRTSPFAWGYSLGQDFQLNSVFTAGYDLGFLSVNGDEGMAGGSLQTLEKFVSYSLMGSIKLWF